MEQRDGVGRSSDPNDLLAAGWDPESGDAVLAGPDPSGVRAKIRDHTARLSAQAIGVPATVDKTGVPPGPYGEKGPIYRSFGDGYSRAFELAVTPVLFGAIGYGLDRWIGILPVLTMIFTLLAVVALSLRTWFGYVQQMEALEAAGPWARRDLGPEPPR